MSQTQRPKRPFQFRLVTILAVVVVLGVFMPLVIFFLHENRPSSSGFEIPAAVGAMILFAGFAGLLSEVICAWKEGDKWS
jgi:hypothetical protein